MLKFDHLAVSANSLQEGVAYVQDALGVALTTGGEHELMGTHNCLLALGDVYLEVISVDPDAPKPNHPRWFDLDNFSGQPRITNWICKLEILRSGIAASPDGMDNILSLSRGDLSWWMALPKDGRLPFNNAYPALIEWRGDLHPTDLLPDAGCSLHSFELIHPQALQMKETLSGLLDDMPLSISRGEKVGFRAEIKTPHGLRVLE